jgi:ATP-dependent Clp protease ATP-binding subunit ClpC
MKEITQSQDVIIFIDELHTLVGAGAAEGSIDASNMLKPALSRGEVQCIGATTLDEYRKYIEKNGALERRFQTIMVDPPSTDDAVDILRGLKDKYERHHRARIVDDAIISAVKLSSQYVSDRYLPDKAIDVIDEACSKVRLEKETFPTNIRDLQRHIEDTVRMKKDMIENQEFEKAVELRDQEEQDRGKLEELKAEWEADRSEEEALVTGEDIAYVVSRMTGIPLQRIEEVENEKLLRMEEDLNARVVGQEEATRLLTKAVRRSRAGLKNPKRPIGSFLFLGPTGVGKTEMARVLAEFMFGDASALIRIDMSEYMERFNVSRLTGAPPGYVGYEEGGQLTERVRRKPYSVILLDEIEKAHPDVYHILLQVMDDGALTDSYGRHIDFKNTIILMTSNLAARSIEKGTALGFQKADDGSGYERVKDNIRDELKKTFNPEFLNRIDDVVIFSPLSHENIMSIVEIEIDKVNQTLADKEMRLELTDEAREWLAKEGYDPSYGARPLRRVIQRHIEDTLSEEVLHGKFQAGGLILVKLAGDELVFETKEDSEIFSIQDA